MKDAWAFCQLDGFWADYTPLSPWGRDEADRREVLTERESIESRYDDIERALAFMDACSGDPARQDRVSHHLKRVPRLPLRASERYELIELFQIKKFLANYRGLVSALGPDTAKAFGLTSVAARLAAELDKGGSDPETFFIADRYDDELAAARAALAELDADERTECARLEASIRLTHGLSFDGREFIVVPRDDAPPPDSPLCALEPYDDTRYLVRPRPQAQALELAARRQALLERERLAEDRVIGRLSELASEAMPELSGAVAALTRWDRAFAGARLARAFGLVRPALDSDAMVLDGARHIPCQRDCADLGLAYQSLCADFSSGAVVLFGSNMGGKTVALKTVLFLQLLAQAGLFVPAIAFKTRVYRAVEYVGELGGERLAGLSGFGFELWRLERAWKEADGALVAFDELARTTGSHEAEALLSAVVSAWALKAGRSGGRAFFATHFRGVRRADGAQFLRMRGLDRQGALEALDADAPLKDRLAGINRHMRYEIVQDDAGDTAGRSDALAIAAMLGLDGNIVADAEAWLSRATERH